MGTIRSITAVAAAAALALTMAACTSDAGEPVEESGPAASDGAFPATVDTAFGEVTVESEPQRIVALGWGDAETALALGFQPVGASDWLGWGGEGVGPYAEGMYDEAPEIIGTMEPSFEAIAALEPDLILDVKSSGDQDRYDRLSSIATTVGIPEGGENWLASAQEQTEMIATALGVPEEGEQLLADLETMFEEQAAAHPEWAGTTSTTAALTSEGWSAYVEGDSRVDFLLNLGFAQNPQVEALPNESGSFSLEISSEELDLLEAELVVAFPIFVDTEQITGDAGWQALPAVQEGRSIVIDGDLANAFSTGTVLAMEWVLEQMVPLLETAVPAE